MNGDYLWDKTGSDPEIEKLENALQLFRLRTSAAPAIGALTVPAEKEPRRRSVFFAFAFASAASLALVLFLLGIWIRVPIRTGTSGDELAGSGTARVEIEITKPAANQPKLPIIQEPGLTMALKKRPIRTEISRRKRNPRSEIPNPKSTIFLTVEEKYAYNQLMLALSITSSKLKLVRDKIESPVYQENNDDKGRRN